MRGRDLATSIYAALTPFAVLAAFSWTMDGRALGFVDLLGGGELLPSTGVLCAHLISTAVRRQELTPVRVALIGAHWFVFMVACLVFAVPPTSAAGYEGRVAAASAITFTLALLLAGAEQVVTSRAKPVPPGRDGDAYPLGPASA